MKNLNKTIKNNPLLSIANLTVTANYIDNKDNNITNLPSEKTILENINLTMYPGEIHVLMGPNGAGKSTLANVLIKNPDYQITSGDIFYNGINLMELTPSACALEGIFLSFQNPIAISGVANIQFLKTSLNSLRKFKGMPSLDSVAFLNLVREKIKILNMPEEFLYRSINEDFSGGEKKRNEMLQMMLLEPKLAILDEIDSGLDLDAIKIIATCIKSAQKQGTAILLITHYNRILDYIEPDFVHIITNRKISLSGKKDLVKELEAKGYNSLIESTISNNLN